MKAKPSKSKYAKDEAAAPKSKKAKKPGIVASVVAAVVEAVAPLVITSASAEPVAVNPKRKPWRISPEWFDHAGRVGGEIGERAQEQMLHGITPRSASAAEAQRLHDANHVFSSVDVDKMIAEHLAKRAADSQR